jgi:hypothetical protein
VFEVVDLNEKVQVDLTELRQELQQGIASETRSRRQADIARTRNIMDELNQKLATEERARIESIKK